MIHINKLKKKKVELKFATYPNKKIKKFKAKNIYNDGKIKKIK